MPKPSFAHLGMSYLEFLKDTGFAIPTYLSGREHAVIRALVDSEKDASTELTFKYISIVHSAEMEEEEYPVELQRAISTQALSMLRSGTVDLEYTNGAVGLSGVYQPDDDDDGEEVVVDDDDDLADGVFPTPAMFMAWKVMILEKAVNDLIEGKSSKEVNACRELIADRVNRARQEEAMYLAILQGCNYDIRKVEAMAKSGVITEDALEQCKEIAKRPRPAIDASQEAVKVVSGRHRRLQLKRKKR